MLPPSASVSPTVYKAPRFRIDPPPNTIPHFTALAPNSFYSPIFLKYLLPANIYPQMACYELHIADDNRRRRTKRLCRLLETQTLSVDEASHFLQEARRVRKQASINATDWTMKPMKTERTKDIKKRNSRTAAERRKERSLNRVTSALLELSIH